MYEAYNEGELAECKPTCEWVPFYEVSLAAAACSKPVMVPCRNGTRRGTPSPNA